MSPSPSSYVSNGQTFTFNNYVCAEMLMGVSDERRTGRLIQIRKGSGAFGSDKYLIRLRDGSLMCFENVLLRHADDERFVEAFYRSNGMTPPTIPDQPPFEGDSEQTEYLIAGGFPETGFIIDKPKGPASATQSFAMLIVQPAKPDNP